MELKVEKSNIPLKNEKLDALIVFVAEDTNVYGSGLSGLPDELKKLLNASLKLKVFSGKKGSKQHFVSGYTKIPQMLAVGLGKKDELDTEALRRAAGNAGKMLSGLKANSVGFLLTSFFKELTETDVGQVIVEGLALGAYEFKNNNKFKKYLICVHCPNWSSEVEKFNKNNNYQIKIWPYPKKTMKLN